MIVKDGQALVKLKMRDPGLPAGKAVRLSPVAGVLAGHEGDEEAEEAKKQPALLSPRLHPKKHRTSANRFSASQLLRGLAA